MQLKFLRNWCLLIILNPQTHTYSGVYRFWMFFSDDIVVFACYLVLQITQIPEHALSQLTQSLKLAFGCQKYY